MQDTPEINKEESAQDSANATGTPTTHDSEIQGTNTLEIAQNAGNERIDALEPTIGDSVKKKNGRKRPSDDAVIADEILEETAPKREETSNTNDKKRSGKILTDEFIEYTADLICGRWKKYQIRQRLERRFGKLDNSTFERGLGRARKNLIKRLEVPIKERLQQSLDYYDSVVSSDPETIEIRQSDGTRTIVKTGCGMREKLIAIERLEKLLGLDGTNRMGNEGEILVRARRITIDTDPLLDPKPIVPPPST